MTQEEMIKQVMAEVLKNLGAAEAPSYQAPAGSVTAAQYPLAEKAPEKLKSASGKAYADFSLAKVISGELTSEDFRTNPEVLIMQAEVAESVGRDAFGRNLRRAAELTAVPDAELLAVYNALRPYRSTKAELLAIADKLDTQYGCKISADFIREAVGVYEARNRLKAE